MAVLLVAAGYLALGFIIGALTGWIAADQTRKGQ